MLRAGRRVVLKLILADGVKDTEEVTEIEALANERGIAIERRDRETLDAWLNNANHQGVLAACADYPYAEFDEIFAAFLAKEGDALLVLLDHVVDPQNLGSLLRTCETAGAVGVVIPTDRAVGVTPAVVRASAGASEHLPVACVSSLPDTLLRLKEAKNEAGEPIFVNVTGLEGADDSEPYTSIDFKGKVAIVVGSEGLGLGKLVSERCDHLAKLPMFGKVSSLNAGVAGAIAIYEVLRQQRG
jgi:23S rRNA (guanosine2251-2'-O)-methyltransferase